MTWTAPTPPDVDEPLTGPERPMLDGWLAAQRSSLLLRCAGLTAEQLVLTPLAPSPLSLLGLVRHVADMERAWFRRRLARQDLGMLYPGADACFHEASADRAERDHAALLAEWAAVDEVLDATADLDTTFVHPTYGVMSLRWAYLHVLREYAGHCGHADLLREQIDGTTYD